MWRNGRRSSTYNMTQIENIKVLALDVDGVLTDGTISFSQILHQESKSFHVHDGLGISLWLKNGKHVILISGRNAECVTIRANELGIKHVKQASKDKIADLSRFLLKIGCTPEEVCFVGDDVGDIAIMQHVGYAIAVHDAVKEVQEIAHWITPRNGGHGAVRDAVEHIMKANNTWDQSISALHTEHANQ